MPNGAVMSLSTVAPVGFDNARGWICVCGSPITHRPALVPLPSVEIGPRSCVLSPGASRENRKSRPVDVPSAQKCTPSGSRFNDRQAFSLLLPLATRSQVATTAPLQQVVWPGVVSQAVDLGHYRRALVEAPGVGPLKVYLAKAAALREAEPVRLYPLRYLVYADNAPPTEVHQPVVEGVVVYQ